MTEDIIGAVAGVCTTIAFIPQLIKTYRSQSAADVSGAMYIVFILGVSLWLLYGIAIASTPMIITNAIVLSQAVIILLLKCWYARRTQS